MKYVLIAASLLLVFAAPVGIADHETTACEPSVAPGTTVAVPTGESGVRGDLYINDRHGENPPGTGLILGPGGTWIYEEFNGVEGLQPDVANGDSTAGEVELCNHDPDFLIF